MTTRSQLGAIVPPFITLAAILLAWQAVVKLAGLQSHLLPAPSAVLLRVYGGIVLGDMLPNLAWTVVIALSGYLIAAVAGLVLAAVLSESPVLEGLTFPIVSGFQAIPKVALAPLILIWAGFGETSEVILVALIAFFPIFNSALIGFKSVDRRLVDLMLTCSGGRLFKFRNLSLPAAAGQIFAGLQISVGFSLVGCVVVEFLIGTGGVGFLIQNSANTLDTATGVAAMLMLAIIGAVAGLAMRALRRRVVFWELSDVRTNRHSENNQ
jgi:NitT/TauT family transport system permease protein